MKTAQLSFFYLLAWSQSADTLTDIKVILGQNVTLDCDFDLKVILWFLLKLPDPPVMIMRTLTEYAEPDYYDRKFTNKYSEQCPSCLSINNITTDDLGIYYCIKPGRGLQISDGVRLHTEVFQEQRGFQAQQQKIHQTVTVTYVILNIGLFVAIAGLLKVSHKLSRKSPEYQNAGLEELHNGDEYSEVQFHVCDKGKTSSNKHTFISTQKQTTKQTYLNI